MTAGIPIDRVALHRVLWRRSGRRHTLKIHQGLFGEELGINPYHLSRILAELEAQGRLKKIANDRFNTGTYRVQDPSEFPDEEPAPER